MAASPGTDGGPVLAAFEARRPLEPSSLPGVILHFFALKRCAEHEGELIGTLHPAEKERAAAMSDRDRRAAYIASRAMLRAALSAFVDGAVAPKDWIFGTGLHGKLHLSAPAGADLRFSLSYTKSTLVVAVSKKYELGVDIEAVDPEASDEVPWHVLTNAERHYLRTLPEAEQFLEFLRLWTLKEAYTKYVGLGATLDFRSVEVSLERSYAYAPEGPATPFVAPVLNQQVFEIGGQKNVVVIAAGKVSAAFVAPAQVPVA
jgi:phosphopantetheinyl transferase